MSKTLIIGKYSMNYDECEINRIEKNKNNNFKIEVLCNLINNETNELYKNCSLYLYNATLKLSSLNTIELQLLDNGENKLYDAIIPLTDTPPIFNNFENY